ncbi:TPA_asm: hypothetical protein GNB58_004916 [Salmonella enterica subsp. houtenae serovar 45:g,z51:-]|uniref:ATP-grasp domain-containing protein n=1 Tax=Salmonella enterica subsp. houtenae serovar 45:g,z51:- TaxID=1967611 RepID=A0A736RFE9_SALHO|nr:hypothetical protein [Salmonella enterica subsp. houtenae str. CFSAN000557]HAE7767787.1 hypothetical protein [Salmonella enterica subsp. houtenae serovar 45:g,z51:-]
MNLYWIVAKEEYSNVADIEHAYAEYTLEFSKRDIEFKFIALEECIVSSVPGAGLKLLHQNQVLDEKVSAFIISPANLNAQARSISSTLRHFLRLKKARLLNEGIAGIETLEWDKIGQMALAESVGSPLLPFSMLGYHRQVIPSVERFNTRYPGECIFKPAGTGMGFGVIKSDTAQHAVSTGNLISSSPVEYFVMPFLAHASDIRFFFVAEKLAFVKFRKPRGEGYIGNVALGGEQIIMAEKDFLSDYGGAPFIAEMLRLSRSIMVRSGCAILSVDWLMNNQGFYFNEMSTAETGLTKLPDGIRAYVFDQLARIINNHHVFE